MEYLAAFGDGLAYRHPDATALIAQQRQQAHDSTT
jgi:hypothetical protein